MEFFDQKTILARQTFLLIESTFFTYTIVWYLLSIVTKPEQKKSAEVRKKGEKKNPKKKFLQIIFIINCNIVFVDLFQQNFW